MSSPSSSEEHGGLNPRELMRLGIPAAGLIDFSVNSNPFGPSPRVLEALRTVDVSAYPDRNCAELTGILAEANRISTEQILVGNGVSELIWLAAQALLKPGDGVLIIGPTFGEYRRACAALGANVTEIRAAEPDFRPPIEEAEDFIRQYHPRLVFLCNPNNPTGTFLDPAVVAGLAGECADETLLVLDEAYRPFADGAFFPCLPSGRCLVLRSMTKDFALAGLRLGYALGEPDLINRLRACQPAWSVNALALAAGAAAIGDIVYYRKTLDDLKVLKMGFFAQFHEAGFDVLSSDVHFGILNFGLPARELRLRLLRQSIQVRDCASFGLPEFIRVSTRLPHENAKLIQALSEIRFS